jgi:hypothetical protein
VSNARRLRILRALIDEEGPVDGIHNDEVRELYGKGGTCPRYQGCTSEGTGESTYRDNPDFFAGERREMAGWLASSFAEGWAANWVCDLEDPRAPGDGVQIDWTVWVELPAISTTPLVLDSAKLILAANEILVEREASPVRFELAEAVTDLVNRSLGRASSERRRIEELIGVLRPAA